MSNNQAFAEFQFAVSHWFKFMDHETRHRAVQVAALAVTTVNHEPSVTQVKEVSRVVGPYYDDPNSPVIKGGLCTLGMDAAKEAPVTKVPSGKGQVFIGKTWMLNKATGERARVAQEEVQAYLARGYIKAGPRSVA